MNKTGWVPVLAHNLLGEARYINKCYHHFAKCYSRRINKVPYKDRRDDKKTFRHKNVREDLLERKKLGGRWYANENATE